MVKMKTARLPAPVQVELDSMSTAAQFHATAGSPSSKSGAFTGGKTMLSTLSGVVCPSSTCMTLSGKLNVTGTSSVSKKMSAESDYRYLEMHADSTISVVLAQMREDKTTLIATIELQASFRRLLKRTMYCELFPWCEGAPIHPSDRMRLPPLLPTTGNCHTGIYACPYAMYQVEFEEAPYMWRCVPSKTLPASTRTRSGAVAMTHTPLRKCRRCGQPGTQFTCFTGTKVQILTPEEPPAKVGLPNVFGYSIKANPSGYACRDTATRTNVTGKTFMSPSSLLSSAVLRSSPAIPASLPTGFSLTRR
jgi:hypothetical protein